LNPQIFFATRSLRRNHIGTDHQKIAKIDRDNEVTPPPKVSASVGSVRAPHIICSWYDFYGFTQVIKKVRDEKGLSQKDCAQKINEKHSVIQDYESGKAIPDVTILSKLERVLNVKLRGRATSPCLHHIAHANGQDLMLERGWGDRKDRSPVWIEIIATVGWNSSFC